MQGNSYVTVPEVADSCGLSYTGLEQHLLFYHKDLVKRRIRIRKKALRRQRKGEITGRGTVHAPSPELVEKYAEAVHLYATTPMSAARIAGKTGVSKKGFYEHLQRWHLDLVCRRKNIPYEEGRLVDWSKVRKYNPATKAKYAEAIRRLKESGLPTAQVAAEFGLQPEAFRSYLKEHEPELYARKGMVRTDTVSFSSWANCSIRILMRLLPVCVRQWFKIKRMIRGRVAAGVCRHGVCAKRCACAQMALRRLM